ncbi:hypothetical protein C0J52_16494 [Blattella germanica]|nr:hypothetical protein C0J52_16494 [Blattella germanica]
MARDSPVGSPVVSRRNDLNSLNNSYHIDPGLHEQAFQQQILQFIHVSDLHSSALYSKFMSCHKIPAGESGQ